MARLTNESVVHTPTPTCTMFTDGNDNTSRPKNINLKCAPNEF